MIEVSERQNHYVGDFKVYLVDDQHLKLITNIQELSPTDVVSIIRHQHRRRISVNSAQPSYLQTSAFNFRHAECDKHT